MKDTVQCTHIHLLAAFQAALLETKALAPKFVFPALPVIFPKALAIREPKIREAVNGAGQCISSGVPSFIPQLLQECLLCAWSWDQHLPRGEVPAYFIQKSPSEGHFHQN